MCNLLFSGELVTIDKNNFYIYQHLKEDTKEIFYVGKGNKKRAYSRNRSEYWKRIVNKHGLIVEIIHQELDEKTAFKLEIEIIQMYRAQGIKLVNMTDGGEGTSGRITTDESRINYRQARLGDKNPMFERTHDPEIREKIRKASVINHANPDTKAKLIKSLTGKIRTDDMKEKYRQVRTGTTRSDETKKKLSEAKKGKPSNRKGVKLSEETKTKIRLANLGKKHSQETKDKVAASSKGRVMSEETKQKISEANKGKISNRKGKTGFVTSEETKQKLREINLGKTLSDETRKKMSEAHSKNHYKSSKIVRN